MAKYTLSGNSSISMSKDAADKLISRGDGEVALVYLCILRSDGDISADKIAADLNISRTAVQTRMSRARNQLKEVLTEYE